MNQIELIRNSNKTTIIKPIEQPKPVLKWAGGKTQLLPILREEIPETYGKYIEPFFGGGALYFDLKPKSSVISDINPELINLYTTLRDDVDSVISELQKHANNKTHFYQVRALDWSSLTAAEAAARTIYLNRTCFNGLYRVNRNGKFNVPYGNYKNPKILNEPNLKAVSRELANTQIILGDYLTVLESYAEPGDLIFLDPPYLPISEHSDFKRYTKEQFHEDDHRKLAVEVDRLASLGCHVLITNSNHPLVYELYKKYKITTHATKRRISARADRRTSEDTLIKIEPRLKQSSEINHFPPLGAPPLSSQVKAFPSTRYMGSKSKLLDEIWSVASQFEYTNVLDLFSGSGAVSYMFKAQGKNVIANDYMTFSANHTKALVENSTQTLSKDTVNWLLDSHFDHDSFVSSTFKDLYFNDEDNDTIDSLRFGIASLDNAYDRSIAMAALTRACTKKRPRGIFTYTGMRYNDGRKDLKLTLKDHFKSAVDAINDAIFDNGTTCKSINSDAFSISQEPNSLVYFDPPYYSPHSDNEYVRRYHFIEGLARDWKDLTIQDHTRTKKFKNYPTPFSSRNGAINAFESLFKKHQRSIILVSYSSNSLPTKEEMISMLRKHKQKVEVLPILHRYSIGNQHHKIAQNNNSVTEYLFVGY